MSTPGPAASEPPGAGPSGAARVWPLSGAWRVWFWGSVVVCLLFLVAGIGLAVVAVVAASVGAPAGLLLLLPAGLLLAIGATMGWQLRHLATTISLEPDGALVIRRPMGDLRVHATEVHRVRASAFASPPNTPTVVETPRGWAYLVRARSEKDAVVRAIRAHHPRPGHR